MVIKAPILRVLVAAFFMPVSPAFAADPGPGNPITVAFAISFAMLLGAGPLSRLLVRRKVSGIMRQNSRGSMAEDSAVVVDEVETQSPLEIVEIQSDGVAGSTDAQLAYAAGGY